MCTMPWSLHLHQHLAEADWINVALCSKTRVGCAPLQTAHEVHYSAVHCSIYCLHLERLQLSALGASRAIGNCNHETPRLW